MTDDKIDGQRLARLAIYNWTGELWIADRIDRLIRKRMAEAWEEGWFHKTAGTKLDDNPYRGRSKP